MGWLVDPSNILEQIALGGWTNVHTSPEPVIPTGGWLTITYMLAEAGLINITPQAIERILSDARVSNLDLLPRVVMDYMFAADAQAVADTLNISPKLALQVLTSTLTPTVSIGDAIGKGSIVSLAPGPSLALPNASGVVKVIAAAPANPLNISYSFTLRMVVNAIADTLGIVPAAALTFPPHAPELTTFNVAGAYSWPVPNWCDAFDYALLGGGAGGSNGGFVLVGQGGNPGVWVTGTVVRGQPGFPTAANVTGTIGSGGPGKANIGGNGTATTAAATGMMSQNAAGGLGASGAAHTGIGPGNKVYNGQTYPGGGNQSVGGGAGLPPGGAGAGGNLFGNGGKGASGAAYYYAYKL